MGRQPQVGDRVHVEFDGVVKNTSTFSCTVSLDKKEGLIYARHEQCTVIVPPIKVGDVVTADNIGQLPPFSIIAFTCAVHLKTQKGKWEGSPGSSFRDADLLSSSEQPCVLRIGGGA